MDEAEARGSSTRPGGLEFALAGLACLLCLRDVSAVGHPGMHWQGGGLDPFADYDSNWVIRTIAAVALAANLLIVGVVVLASLGRLSGTSGRVALMVGCVIGAILPWLELWWGSTF